MVYIESKAGRFVGKTGRCAVLVIADYAKFSLAVNRMAIVRTQSTN